MFYLETNRYILNIPALKTWLLDYEIWKDNPDFGIIIYSSLANALCDKQFGDINTSTLKEAGMLKSFFLFFKTNLKDLPLELGEYIHKILTRLLDPVPSRSNFQTIVKYLIITHPFPTSPNRFRQSNPIPKEEIFFSKNDNLPSIRTIILNLLFGKKLLE